MSNDARTIGSIAAHVKWAFCEDRTAATSAARETFLKGFEKLVDPDGVLDPEERTKRARNAIAAHFRRLALKSAAVRRARGAARRAAVDEATK